LGEKKTWVRPLSFVKGPFKFFYTAHYEAEDGDELWKLVSFRTIGNEPIKDFPLSQKIELIQKFGRQAARAAHEEAEKPMRVPKEPEKVVALNTQSKFPL
jgi:hypothetical protein